MTTPEKSNKGSLAKSFLIGLMLGLSVLLIYNFGLPLYQKPKVANDVKKLYELANPGSSVEVTAVNDEGSMYKILLKVSNSQGTNYLEVFTTKDGRFLSESVIFVRESITQIEKMKKFVDCLFDRGVRIYGALNIDNQNITAATQLQLNILGRYSSKLYVSCDGELLQQCTNLGLQALPALVYNNTAYYGVFSTDYMEKLTGCKL